MYLKMMGGKVKVNIVGKKGKGDKLVLIAEDPDTGKRYPIVNPIVTLKRMKYKTLT